MYEISFPKVTIEENVWTVDAHLSNLDSKNRYCFFIQVDLFSKDHHVYHSAFATVVPPSAELELLDIFRFRPKTPGNYTYIFFIGSYYIDSEELLDFCLSLANATIDVEAFYCGIGLAPCCCTEVFPTLWYQSQEEGELLVLTLTQIYENLRDLSQKQSQLDRKIEEKVAYLDEKIDQINSRIDDLFKLIESTNDKIDDRFIQILGVTMALITLVHKEVIGHVREGVARFLRKRYEHKTEPKNNH